MFNADINRDDASAQVTRRLFVAGCAAIAASTALLALHAPAGPEASTQVHGRPGMVTIVNFSNDGRNLGEQTVAKIVKTDGEWYRQLGRNSFDMARKGDTEMPSAANGARGNTEGVYRCIGCDTALFSSQTRYDSGEGWPSFWAPLAKANIVKVEDVSAGAPRTEVRCVRCEAHLGHVFGDGPQPTGLRYCMNSSSLHFARA